MEEEQFDPNEATEQLDFENETLKNQNLDLTRALHSSQIGGEDDLNLIQYQLETDKILERVEHFLKGDTIKFSDKGSYFSEPTKNVLTLVKRDPKAKLTYFIQEFKKFDPDKKVEQVSEVLVKIKKEGKDGKYQEVDIMKEDSQKILDRIKEMKLQDQGYQYISIVDENKKPLNEYGVAEVMRIMSMYITKETFLSYYDEDRINEILGDLGDALNNFLYCNYEKMGMDTKYKESKYMLLVINLLHVVESCYRRALKGGEQYNIRSRSIVTQNESGGGGGMPRRPPVKPKWSPVKPSTW